MTSLDLQKNEKWFILGLALLQGIALLLIWLWIDQLADARQSLNIILPLYVLAICFPLSMMLLAHQPRKQAFTLVSIFTLVAALCAMYAGDISYVKSLPSYRTQGAIYQFGFCMLAVWFICVTFIEHYCGYQHWFNRYESLYDFSWRNAVKLITASIFTGLFWAALLLLAGLFKVLGITLFDDIISSVYFSYPATTVAAGLGLSLYEAKQEALSEFKRAILQVLGWLLPLVGFILIAFIITLPFKGLSALWGTGYATSLILGLLALKVFLLNTAFQDGKQIQYPHWLLKLTNFSALIMPVYAVLCIYALYLRVAQYGWTDDRVWAASITFIATLYSVGYAYAAIHSFKTNTIWMQKIKPVNVMTAICLVAVVGLVHSPILNPTRIGVQSQLARLNDGKVSAKGFDFDYLRFSGGKYGDTALRTLLADTGNANAATIKPLIEATLKSDYPSAKAYQTEAKKWITNAKDIEARATIYPIGTTVDSAFFEALFLEHQSEQLYLPCLEQNMQTKTDEKLTCKILAIDLNKDNQAELVLFADRPGRVYEKKAKNWRYVGNLHAKCCSDAEGDDNPKATQVAALLAGEATAEAPAWQDLKLGNKTYRMNNY